MPKPNTGVAATTAIDTSSKFCTILIQYDGESIYSPCTTKETASFFSAVICPPINRYSLIKVAYTTLIPPIEATLSAVLFLLFNPHTNQMIRIAMTINTIDMIVRAFVLLLQKLDEIYLEVFQSLKPTRRQELILHRLFYYRPSSLLLLDPKSNLVSLSRHFSIFEEGHHHPSQ